MKVRHYFQGNNLYSVLLMFSLVSLSVGRYFFVTDFARSWDAVDFALGVKQFDLLQMQPHFPGYPYFIVGGMLFNHFVEDPVKSLIILNITITGTSILPIYWIAKRYLTTSKALIMALLLHTLPYFNMMVIQPMSEAAGIAVLWWYIWSLFIALEKRTWRVLWLPSFLFSVLLGIRVSYLVFGVGLVWLWIKDVKDSSGNKIVRITVHLLCAAFFQFLWIWALVASLGGLSSFIKISLAFVAGHFQDWGGTAVAEEGSLLQRLSQLILEQWLWNSWFAHSTIMAFLTLLFVGAGFYLRKEKLEVNHSSLLIGLMSFTYFIWVLFAQNIDKPRHIVPFTLLSLAVLLISLLRHNKSIFFSFVTTLLIGSQFFMSLALMNEYEETVPATYQLSAYLEEVEEAFVVYTWEETRVMDYRNVNYEHKRLLTYEYFKEDISNKDKTIYVTGRMIEGFQSQGISLHDKIEKVVTFHSNQLFDPVYHEIELYKWKKKE